MILDENIKNLVKTIESESLNSEELETNLKKLIRELDINLNKKETKEIYKNYETCIKEISRYPIDKDGYALSFDPFEDEKLFIETFQKYGVVVGRKVVDDETCNFAVKRMRDIVLKLSDCKCDLEKKETWVYVPKDESDTAFISRGFFEVYHDKALSEIRQSLRLYIHHVLLWGRVDLWTSFDRLGVKLPHHDESKALPLHIDQNPKIHPKFKTLQGVLALDDCPLGRGTFACVPGSISVFMEYKTFAPDRGEFVEFDQTSEHADILNKNLQPFPLRKGDMVTWDSRTTHANTENISDKTRYVAYVSAGPAREDVEEYKKVRRGAFLSGEGTNFREALMHASKKSRYNNYEKLKTSRENEVLNYLGKLLYGFISYEK